MVLSLQEIKSGGSAHNSIMPERNRPNTCEIKRHHRFRHLQRCMLQEVHPDEDCMEEGTSEENNLLKLIQKVQQ